MAQQIIHVGTGINDGTGDPLRTCFTKINQNFTEIYSRDAAGSNFDFTDNTLSSTNTNGDIILSPNGKGGVVIDDDKLRIKFSRTPASAIGSLGDLNGMIAWDSEYFYVCAGDYDGTHNIWKRTALDGSW